MKIIFLIYDKITLLDFAGSYDPLTRLKAMDFIPDLIYEVSALKEEIRTTEGIRLIPDRVNTDLSNCDYLLIPGGDGVREMMQDQVFINWIRSAGHDTTIAAVCGGVLLIGAAGLLYDTWATTHPGMMEFLRHFTSKVLPDRIVDDGRIITAGGVTAAIDLGLYLVERIAGREIREKIRIQMDYPYYGNI